MRNPGLDVLRFVAVALVLGRHFDERLISGSNVLAAWQRGGWVGVDLFFVLSGFLISGLIFQEQRTTGGFACGRFLVRRAFKIYPAFWALIFFTVAFRWALHMTKGEAALDAAGSLVRPAAIELLFVQNYFTGLYGHTWSLAVEEHFYIVFALLAAWLVRKAPDAPFRPIGVIFVACLVVCMVLRWRTASRPGPLTWYDTLFPTHLRIDSLMFGVFLRQIADRLPEWFSDSRTIRAGMVVLGVACLVPTFLVDLSPESALVVFGLPLFALGSCCLVLAVQGLEPRSQRWWRRPVALIAAAGACSYSTYLWHMLVGSVAASAVKRWMEGSCAVYLAAYLLGSVLVGFATFCAIERPLLVIRDRVAPSRRSKPHANVNDLPV